jgi:hypothetical protein
MRGTIRRSLVSLAFAAAFTSPLLAKGPTVKLAISGHGLPDVLTVTEPAALKANVYGGDFIELQKGAVPEPSPDLLRYTVQFYVAPPRSEVRMMYVVEYVWDCATNRALVHLPGPADKGYSLNTSTIIRSGQDGKWFYASHEWGTAIRNVLP